MEEEPIKETGVPDVEPCPCRDLAENLALLMGIRSPNARRHLQNARIEMLKALRAVIDDRIEHLSRRSAKGSRIVVE